MSVYSYSWHVTHHIVITAGGQTLTETSELFLPSQCPVERNSDLVNMNKIKGMHIEIIIFLALEHDIPPRSGCREAGNRL